MVKIEITSDQAGSIGRHDWAIGHKCEDGFPVFVDDRQIAYRSSIDKGRESALSIIERLAADGDYRLNDKPAGFLPPPLPDFESETTNNHLDSEDQAILEKTVAKREQIERPRIGDYVLFPTGQLERFSHDWGAGLQTSPSGSIYLGSSGHGSFSGGLNPTTPLDALNLTRATLPGSFWFFHHGIAGAGRGVNFEIMCRVYKTTAPYEGFMSGAFQSPKNVELKENLDRQLGAVSKA